MECSLSFLFPYVWLNSIFLLNRTILFVQHDARTINSFHFPSQEALYLFLKSTYSSCVEGHIFKSSLNCSSILPSLNISIIFFSARIRFLSTSFSIIDENLPSSHEAAIEPAPQNKSTKVFF